MSVFDIPELTDLVRSHFTRHDLTVCVRVNKTWNSLFTPFLWHTVTLLKPPLPKSGSLLIGEYPLQCAFGRLLLEDYLTTQQALHTDNDNSNGASLPATSRNGRWIRVLNLHQHHLHEIVTTRHIELYAYRPSPYTPSSIKAKPNFPTSPELILHLVQHCTNLQRLRVSGRCQAGHELEIWHRILTSSLPRTITNLALNLDSQVPLVLSSLPPILFSRFYSNLHELSLHMTHSYPRHNGEQQAVEMKEQEGLLPSMRALNVTCQDGNQCPPSLSWFLRRCTNLESLHVSRLDETWVRALEACIHLKCLQIGSIDEESPKLLTMTLKNGLSSLDSIQIDSCNEGFQDQAIADMLSACHRGWRSISIPRLGAIAIRAVIRHCATLESLTLRRSYGLTSGDILQILSSSPRLESLVTLINDNVRHPCTELTHIMATDFIDAEPFSESLKSWACEPTLKVFRARISGIPRPDITETFTGYPMQDDLILSEDYPGQSHEIQQRVYRRLARLTKIERLELGYEDRDLSDSSRDLGDINEVARLDDEGHHYDCLDISLRSGLKMLEGLRELKVLSVMRMTTRMGVEEFRWMAQNWPKLRRVDGLSFHGSADVAAHEWLKETCPWIQSRICSRSEPVQYLY